MSPTKTLLGIALALFAATPFAAAQDVHIPADYPTIQQGIDHVGFGGTVWVDNGTYKEVLIIDPFAKYGTIHGWVNMRIEGTGSNVIISYPYLVHPQPATIDPPSAQYGPLDYNLAVIQMAHFEIKNVQFFGNGEWDQSHAGGPVGLYMEKAPGLVEDCQFSWYKRLILAGTPPSNHGYLGDGMHVSGASSNVKIDACKFQEIALAGFVAYQSAHIEVTQSQFDGQITPLIDPSGVYEYGLASGIVLDDTYFPNPVIKPATGSVTSCTFSHFEHYPSIEAHNDIDIADCLFDQSWGVSIELVQDAPNLQAWIYDNTFTLPTSFGVGLIPWGIGLSRFNKLAPAPIPYSGHVTVYGNTIDGPGLGISLNTPGHDYSVTATYNGLFAYPPVDTLTTTPFDSSITFDHNYYDDINFNPLGPTQYLIYGSAGYIDQHPLPASKATLYNGGYINPANSLTMISGSPHIGQVWTVGIDNPLGTQAPGATAVFILSFSPPASFGWGIPIPGWGMGGSMGELLINLAAPLYTYVAASPWAGPGSPASVNVPIGYAPAYVGMNMYGQGYLWDTTPGATYPTGLTSAVHTTIGF